MVTSMKRELGGGHAGAGGMTVHVTVNGFVGNNHELAEVLREAMQTETLRYARRNGLSNGLSLRG
jgi:nanoRNase/pAp phosphatase (c-di-AMP/oligoRNAs hydrolase)